MGDYLEQSFTVINKNIRSKTQNFNYFITNLEALPLNQPLTLPLN